MVCTPDGDTDFFDIVARVLQGDILVPCMFRICLDSNIDRSNKRNGFILKNQETDDIPQKL